MAPRQTKCPFYLRPNLTPPQLNAFTRPPPVGPPPPLTQSLPHTFIRDEVAQALNVLLALKRWIRVQVPKIEDGNNFGVSVQLDVAKGIDDLTAPVASSLGKRQPSRLLPPVVRRALRKVVEVLQFSAWFRSYEGTLISLYALLVPSSLTFLWASQTTKKKRKNR